MRTLFCISAALALLVTAAPAKADPTGIVAVPTADILRLGEWRLKAQQDLDHLNTSMARRTSVLTQFGLATRIEAGLDLQGVGHEDHLVGNAKYQLIAPEEGAFGAAVGIANVANRRKPLYYGVASTTVSQFRLHGGLAGDGHIRVLLGAELPLGDRFNVFGEWITGPAGPVSAGFQYQVTDAIGAQIYWQGANNRSDLERIQLRLWYIGSFLD